MALVTCPDCSKEISDAAPVCPGCGRPAPAAPAAPPAAPAASGSGSVGPIHVVLVVGVAVLVGWWMLRQPAREAPDTTTSTLSSIPYPGDNAVAKGCAAFGSEDAQTEGDRAAVAGDKDQFRTLVIASGGRHIDDGERVRVTGLGQKTDHRRIEDAAGRGWWVSYSCLAKVQ